MVNHKSTKASLGEWVEWCIDRSIRGDLPLSRLHEAGGGGDESMEEGDPIVEGMNLGTS